VAIHAKHDNIRSRKYNKSDFAEHAFYVSSLFDWYWEDYLQWLLAKGETEPTILDFITRYLSMSKRNRLEHCDDCALRFIAMIGN